MNQQNIVEDEKEKNKRKSFNLGKSNDISNSNIKEDELFIKKRLPDSTKKNLENSFPENNINTENYNNNQMNLQGSIITFITKKDSLKKRENKQIQDTMQEKQNNNIKDEDIKDMNFYKKKSNKYKNNNRYDTNLNNFNNNLSERSNINNKINRNNEGKNKKWKCENCELEFDEFVPKCTFCDKESPYFQKYKINEMEGYYHNSNISENKNNGINQNKQNLDIISQNFNNSNIQKNNINNNLHKDNNPKNNNNNLNNNNNKQNNNNGKERIDYFKQNQSQINNGNNILLRNENNKKINKNDLNNIKENENNSLDIKKKDIKRINNEINQQLNPKKEINQICEFCSKPYKDFCLYCYNKQKQNDIIQQYQNKSPQPKRNKNFQKRIKCIYCESEMFYDNKCAKCGEIAKWKCSKCQNINPITYIECINCKHGKDN